tara:strand:+ start:649 stop:1995 length:1347 start_codon:yes stop_codon:yes gene_type:complete
VWLESFKLLNSDRRLATNEIRIVIMKMFKCKLAGVGAAIVCLTVSNSLAADVNAVLKNYADIAHAGYEDSLNTAKTLRNAVAALAGVPSAEALAAARGAWLAARVPYQQTEVYRFGNKTVDDWEGKVNAWPLDEGLIDYVDRGAYGKTSEENRLYSANVIANARLMVAGKPVDASRITKILLSDTLHEAEEVEANVATGYHAIEFLLWGQDLNGTNFGAGKRPHSDFDVNNCSGGNCDRRIAYLLAVTDLMIDDLQYIVKAWGPGGEARNTILGAGKGGLIAILTGMGSLSYGELAGERMKLGLLLHDPEEEHDCFSDNTHNSHYYNAKGIRNVYLGRYNRTDGRVVRGASLADLLREKSPELHLEMMANLDSTMLAMGALVQAAEDGESYDQMLGEGNKKGNARVQQAIEALVAQTKTIEKAVSALGLKSIAFEGSDSLDNPKAVFQ